MDHEAHISEDEGGDEVLLDVRPLIERGEEPFGTIMETVASLDGRSLLLVAPFEPTPLEGVLGAQGFTYEAECVSETEWRVLFRPGGDAGGPGDPGSRSDEVVPGVEEPKDDDADGRPPPVSATESPYTIKRPATTTASVDEAAIRARVESPSVQQMTPPPVMAMNPTLNVPPAWLPLAFMAAAGLGLIGFGLAVTITAPTVVTVPRSDHVIAAVHYGLLAFLSTAVLGALHQFGPVVGGKPLRSIPGAVATAVVFVPAAWLIPIGFATGHVRIIQVGGVLATTAVCLAAWNVSRPLSATGKGAPIVGLRLAVTYLVVTAAFGVAYAFDRGAFWFELLPNRVLAHAHIGLLGWLGLAYVAVAEKLWPMFLLAHRPHVRHGERAVWLVGVGAPVLAVGLLVPSSVTSVVGGALVVGGLASHLASLHTVIHHRRRGLELLHGFVLTSAACLVIAVVIGVIAALEPMAPATRSRLVTTEVACLILWLALAVLGHSHKIVPFISWNRLRDRGIRTGRDGRPLLFAHLVNPGLARITFGLAVLGALAGVVGTLTLSAVFVRVAGASLGLAGVTAIANLASGPLLMIRWHDGQGQQAPFQDREVVAS